MSEEQQTLKMCSQCNCEKPESKFYKIRKPGWQVTYCNDCVAINIREWMKKK